jgi:hypothetical protein
MKMEPNLDGIALYHVVLAQEDFDRTAFNLLQLIQRAQREYAGQKRTLFLDIEGHRNANGGFDDDMLELQSKFTTEFLLQFLSRIVTPLATIDNPHPQNNNVSGELNVVSIDGRPGEEPPETTPDGPNRPRRF